ncbi:DHH family phosphoesterase [Enterococcus hulanensis]|uniref:Cyclic-di-AMP phosphodiesterase n=1 Tax=Enterococcus hulanensis TaxID=2559929 RepID=A0ABU3F5J7_9ENTE|nr:DHH family phosphoesterase [Enterococcus hulanensis]MDT2602410.1 DHH family phosphoesterase [Enterococcus hulanensis]MDT2611785.1 DHH family phosphoesterase [Enterococcus hulanensis]MDT2618979.1 DHH family phosphoesterase [Enterococcus hulanensis]MDT2630482.1 DHH family phosphoesterase [Enterococcus hulanensis]MDT2657968.1 DHH family phosphoesterase [Enterococcus hulanensis]
MKKNLRIKGSFFFFCLLLIQLAAIFLLPFTAVTAGIVILIDLSLWMYMIVLRNRVEISNQQKIQYASHRAQEALDYVSVEMPVGIITWDDNNTFTWTNPAITESVQQLTKDDQQDMINELLQRAEKGKNIYKIDNILYHFDLNLEKRIVYLIDVTKEYTLENKEKQQQAVVGILSVDNYDDVIDRRDDKEVSNLNSFITTIISDWMDSYRIFYKRVNAERFFLFGRYDDLEKMIENNFDLLEHIRVSAEKQDMLITISMGISYGTESLEVIGDEAQNNLDIALVRGGDQVVVKNAAEGKKPVFYGGNSASAAKRTRVRSRAMSTALKNVFNQTGNVFVMGHRFPDMDAIGSAFGVACLARYHDKKVRIVINEEETIPDVERCLEEIHQNGELENLLISPEAAKKQRKAGDLLVMVDYHRPSLSIDQELYEQFENIVIIDHHRRGDEFPDNSLLTYIESSASSASELVTELIQFESNEQQKMSKMEATLLLAGITVDTKNFAVRTTARTFDVASYLKTCGADASLVQYLLSTDIQSYLEISKLVGESDYVRDDIVVATGTEDQKYDSVTAAKTADTLLSMVDINAAFVIIKRTDGVIAISARSSGTINVQRVMEVLGGGGHFTNAATQLENSTIAEAKQRLLEAINKQLTEGTEE